MSDLQALLVAGELLYTFDWTDVVPAGVAITAVDYVVPSPLVQFADADDFVNKRSTIGLRSSVHGQTCQVRAVATLNNGDKVPKNLTVRGFNG